MKSIQFRQTLIAAAMTAIIGATGAVYAQTSSTSPTESATVGDAITDTAITTKVKAKLIADNRTKTVKISVETNNGIVTLSGKARSHKAKAAAEKIASEVDGVKSVINNVTVGVRTESVGTKTEKAADATGEAVSDTWITTKVKSSLLTDKNIKDGDVSVETTDGVVTLTGTVPTAAQKTHAVASIKKIKGVKSVDAAALTVAPAQ
jgi:hyperosmotically inducible protein